MPTGQERVPVSLSVLDDTGMMCTSLRTGDGTLLEEISKILGRRCQPAVTPRKFL